MLLHPDTLKRLRKNGFWDHIAHVVTVGRYIEQLSLAKRWPTSHRDVVTIYNGASLYLPKQALGLGKELLRHGIHEPTATRLYEEFLEPGDQIFEAGANIGYYISVADNALSGTGSFLAVEPDPEVYGTLTQNVASFRGRVNLNQLAVSDHIGTTSFYQSASSNLGSIRKSRRTDDRALKVQTSTIDRLCETHNFSPTVLRMDIECAEVFALRGAQKVLARFKPKIFIELHPTLMTADELAEVLGLLRSNGYRSLTVVDRSYDSPTALRFLKRAQPQAIDINRLEVLLSERYVTALGVFSKSTH
jgi:FkbM family methyltransferase